MRHLRGIVTLAAAGLHPWASLAEAASPTVPKSLVRFYVSQERMKKGDEPVCSGVVTSAKWVITAGHCRVGKGTFVHSPALGTSTKVERQLFLKEWPCGDEKDYSVARLEGAIGEPANQASVNPGQANGWTHASNAPLDLKKKVVTDCKPLLQGKPEGLSCFQGEQGVAIGGDSGGGIFGAGDTLVSMLIETDWKKGAKSQRLHLSIQPDSWATFVARCAKDQWDATFCVEKLPKCSK